MQELAELTSLAGHKCATPRIERWEVYEPVSHRWSTLTLFLCCSQAYDERPASADQHAPQVRKAA